MPCFYKCIENNFVYLIHTVLQRSNLAEHTRTFLFCSTECLDNFKREFITEDEDGCEYYNKVENDNHNDDRWCLFQMMEIVEKYKNKCKKAKMMKMQQIDDNTVEPPAKMIKN